MTRFILAVGVAVFLFFFFTGGTVARAAELPTATPEEVGLSSSRLARLERVLRDHVEDGELPGVVAMVARRGRVPWRLTAGYSDIEADRPLTEDALFRVASMTKMVTIVAALTLYEEGRFQLTDPAQRWLPELAEVRVAGEGWTPDDPDQHLVAPRSPITIRDLMRHTSGFTYGGGGHPVDALYRPAGLRSWPGDLAGFVRTLAAVPLAFHPGEAWEYSLSTDVLGRLVEVVAGKPLDRVFEERVCAPLDMRDTGFVVSDTDLPRLTDVYLFDQGGLKLLEAARESPLRKRPPAFSGGGGWAELGSDGGLVSTARDYLRLLQMLLDGGRLGEVRVLGRKTVELMMTDHLDGIPTWLGPGVGFGLGVAVLTDVGASGELGSVGQVWWAGSDNTYFWIDPKEEMIGLLMVQVRPFGHLDLMNRFAILAQQAIDD
jgi:CubicO group peptidase (beta-lactamase class C family)